MAELSKGSPLKTILLFTFPIFLGNIIQQIYSLADAVIVGQTISNEALGGVGATGWLYSLLINLICGLMLGFSLYTSQRYGAKDSVGVKKSLIQGIIIGSILSVVLSIVFIFGARPFLTLLNTPESQIEHAVTYLVIISGFLIVTVFYNLFANILRAVGNSLLPLIFLTVAALTNIGLDFLFILVFKMGVEGAALATGLSQLLALILCASYTFIKYPFFRFNLKEFRFDKETAKKEIHIGLPMAFNYSLISIGLIVVQYALNSLGSNYNTAFTLAGKMEGIFAQFLYAIGSAFAVYVGQNYGANNYERIKEGLKQVLILGCVSAVILGAGLIIFARPILLLLSRADTEAVIIDNAVTYMLFNGLFYVPLVLLLIHRNGLMGFNRSSYTAIAGLLEFLSRAIFSMLGLYIFGYIGVVLSISVCWIITGTYLTIIYYKVAPKVKLELDNNLRLLEIEKENVNNIPILEQTI
jgi:putative MATE family efflux protein